MRLSWDDVGQRFFEAGADRGVFYPRDLPGIPWNGLVAVKEAPTDSESGVFYLDGVKHQNGQSRGSYAAQIDAITYPPILDNYRDVFGFCYRTGLGNDTQDLNLGYKLHLVYNALAIPSAVDYSTVDSGSSPTIFSWGLTTTPMIIPTAGASAHLIIDSTRTYSGVMSDFEDIIYGTSDTPARIPSITEVLDFFDERALIKITDHGDGTWSAEGPEELIQMLDSTTFEITSGGAVYIDTETYTIRSW